MKIYNSLFLLAILAVVSVKANDIDWTRVKEIMDDLHRLNRGEISSFVILQITTHKTEDLESEQAREVAAVEGIFKITRPLTTSVLNEARTEELTKAQAEQMCEGMQKGLNDYLENLCKAKHIELKEETRKKCEKVMTGGISKFQELCPELIKILS